MNRELDRLLLIHIAAWQRNTKETDFVEQVNDTYAAYLAGGGNDKHYKARWDKLRARYEHTATARKGAPT